MKTWIQTLRTSDGYLRDAEINFTQGLNCIIGPRGTCKSTIVETIRFAHDIDPAKITQLTNSSASAPSSGTSGLLQATLGSGTVSCNLHVSDDIDSPSEIRLERSIDGSRPRVYREDVLEATATLTDFPAEIYSQGDLIKLAENSEQRLRLIDRPHIDQIRTIHAQISEHHNEIIAIGNEILRLRSAISDHRQNLSPLTELESQLNSVISQRPNLDATFATERDNYEKRERLVSSSRSLWRSFSRAFAVGTPQTPNAEEVLRLSEALDAVQISEASRLAAQLRTLASLASQISQQYIDAQTLLAQTTSTIASLEPRFDELNERYRHLRREQDALSASLEHEDRIRSQIRRIGALSDEMKRYEAKLNSLLTHRSERRKQIELGLDEVFRLRLGEIEVIEADLGSEISLSITQGAQSTVYANAIADLLQGTRLKRQREIAGQIASMLSPVDFITIIENEETSRLAQALNLDETQASRIINHLLDNMQQTLELERVLPDDQLKIALSVDGELRPIEQLSRGQMATALLPLIVRHAECPLVFDQPEDDLDNRFIYNELVARVRRVKQTRQLIFVTHNANIPVLGDADRVIVMSMTNARQAAPPKEGTVDDMRSQIIEILEGGVAAFKERRKRYKDLI